MVVSAWFIENISLISFFRPFYLIYVLTYFRTIMLLRERERENQMRGVSPTIVPLHATYFVFKRKEWSFFVPYDFAMEKSKWGFWKTPGRLSIIFR